MCAIMRTLKTFLSIQLTLLKGNTNVWSILQTPDPTAKSNGTNILQVKKFPKFEQNSRSGTPANVVSAGCVHKRIYLVSLSRNKPAESIR